MYYDAISLDLVTRQQDQTSLATFFLPDGEIRGPVPTSFQVNEQKLRTPYYRTASFTVERKLPFDFYAKSGYHASDRFQRLLLQPGVAARRNAVLQRRGL